MGYCFYFSTAFSPDSFHYSWLIQNGLNDYISEIMLPPTQGAEFYCFILLFAKLSIIFDFGSKVSRVCIVAEERSAKLKFPPTKTVLYNIYYFKDAW